MLDIIPNWHPVFVHFTVALLSLAAGLFVVSPLLKPPLQEQWRIVARCLLWFGAGFMVITGLTGLDAYNTVAHDTPSHAAMTDHRNWAVATIVIFLALTAWSALRARRNQALGAVFVAAMVIAGGVLASTAWRGGEVVYRYGLGVMSLPQVESGAEGEGHAHEHTDGTGHDHSSVSPVVADALKTAEEHHEHGDDHPAATPRDDQAQTDMGTANSPAKPHDHHDDGHAHDH